MENTIYISAGINRLSSRFVGALSGFGLWHQWKATGLLFNWLTIACAVWVGLVILGAWLAHLDAPEIL